MAHKTTYQEFEESSPKARRLLREEELILQVQEELLRAMDEAKLTKADLARRLERSKGFVSQLLSGGRNLTVRTIADVADALGFQPTLQLEEPNAALIWLHQASASPSVQHLTGSTTTAFRNVTANSTGPGSISIPRGESHVQTP